MPSLLMRRANRLAFPGGKPGFDPSHVAAQGITPGLGISAVATTSGFVNLLNGVPGTVVGTVSPRINGVLGPAPSGNNGGYAWTGYTSNLNSAIGNTMAVIITNAGDNGLAGTILVTHSNGGVLNFGLNNLDAWVFQGGGVTDPLPYTLLLNVPYFLAFSANSSVMNVVVVRLDTGQVVRQYTTPVAGTLTGAPIDAYVIMNASTAAGGSFNMNGSMAAAMHAPNYLSPQQLLQWAQDPWSFWYPQKFDIGMMLGGAGAATPSGTLAATETPDVAAFTGSYSVASSFALTEGQDVAAFAGNYAVAASFALTEGADVAAFAGDFAGIATGTLAATEAPDIAAFAITNASVLADTHDGFSRRAIEDDDDGPIEEIVRPVPEKVRASIERARARIEGKGNLTMAQATAAVTLIDSIEHSVAYAGPEPRLVAELVASLNKVAADISKVEQASAINRLRRIEQDLDDERASMILLGAYPGETRWQMQTH